MGADRDRQRGLTGRSPWIWFAAGAASAGLALVALGAIFWPRGELVVPPPADRVVLSQASFEDLADWRADRQGEALSALRRSCDKLERSNDERALGVDGIGGLVEDWRAPCAAAGSLGATDHEAARRFFETWFVPFEVTNNGEAEGLFTGYYEPELRASRTRHGAYLVPIYGRPSDLVTVDLGRFDSELRGRSIAGRVKGGALDLYDSRAEIVAGALAGRAPVLYWADDPVATFFLQIQGSGRLVLDDGEVVRLGYAAKNGRPYFAIGRELVRRGAFSPEEVSLDAIRDWLKLNPDQAEAVMALNASFVFFRELAGEGPIGAQGVPLTPGRSLAIDRRFLFMGAPLWLDTALPSAESGGPDRPWRRLMIAQDTGGAIRGPVRGDIFFGAGAEAEALAGALKHPGRYFLLLPKEAAARRAPTS